MSEASVIDGLEPAQPPDGLNPDQSTIWSVFEHAKIKALKKNHDYGSSVFQRPALRPDLDCTTAIEVRMSDKVARLANVLSGAEQLVSDETVNDTMGDLGVYAFLWLIARNRETE